MKRLISSLPGAFGKIGKITKPVLLTIFWTALCYAMGAGAWLSWWYRLASRLDSVTADLVSMVAGYLLQAVGVWSAILLLRRKGEKKIAPWILGAVLLFVAAMAFSLVSSSLPSLLFWGMLMNLVDGILAGFYLYAIFINSENNSHGLLFGCGYALLTPLMYVLAIMGNGSFFRHDSALWVYLVMAALAAGLVYPLFSEKNQPGEMAAAGGLTDGSSSLDGTAREGISHNFIGKDRSLWGLSLFILFLFSLVKNLGFSFPSSDMMAGINVELSRLFYGAGLAAAGLIYARSPKTGAICALASLVISFVMLAMEEEPVLRVVFWALDYFFFAFVSVYRVALPMDLARSADGAESPEMAGYAADRKAVSLHPASSVIAPAQSMDLSRSAIRDVQTLDSVRSIAGAALPMALMGLIVGRIGDAAGTLLCVSLSGRRLWLILLTLILFVAAVFLFFRLYLALYLPRQKKERSEQEIFAEFAMHHDFSDREKEVFRLLLSGRSNGEIAEALFVSENTVKFHVHNLLQKTGCRNRRELTWKFQKLLYPGIMEKPPSSVDE